MTGSTTQSDAVPVLLQRAIGAGLGVGWVALAVRDGGDGLCWTAGTSGIGGPPVDADLRYDLASLTKPLVVTTLLLIARRDGLDLDAPLMQHLPELAGSPWEHVTLWQCAAHCAGFPAWAPLYALGGCSRAGYLDAITRIAPVGRPGERVEYSCLGFIALGIVLERGGGADLATLFHDLVAEPLGIGDEMGFTPPAGTAVAGGESDWFVERRLLAERTLAGSPPARLAGAASCDDGNARGLGGVAGNAGLFGTASAVALLAAEYLPDGGELLDAEEVTFATRCLTAGMNQTRGIGWQLAATPGCSAGPAIPPSAYGHTGFTGTSLWVDPGARAVYVLLGNRLHPGGRTPDLHPLRRRFHSFASDALLRGAAGASISNR